ncbi:MAG: hypothetical protein GC206_02870 [Alphaproteobacteria bacterium]|nr:hypothetical protein [Alphaproteobacteria bacterium]
MKILFDQGTPAPLRRALVGHDVSIAFELGWSTLSNGALLNAAEADGYSMLITTDQNLRYQQNLSNRRLAVVILSTTDWRRIQSHVHLVCDAVDAAAAGDVIAVTIPPR